MSRSDLLSLARPVLACLTLLTVVPALADEESAPTLEETVVVTASRETQPVDEAPSAVTVLDGETLRSQGVSSLEDALRRVPGATLVRSGSPGKASSLFVRGANSNQVLVLYDGVELNTPFFGGYDLSHLSLSEVERVEVVRGPFSALYGSQAIGGVVNVITRRAEGPGLSGEVQLEAGSDDHRRGDVSVTAAGDRFFFTGTYDRVETENLGGESVDLAGFRVLFDNDDYERTTRSARTGVALPGGGEVALSLRETEAALGVPWASILPGVGPQMTPRARQVIDETVFALPARFVLGDAGTLQLTLARVEQDFDFRDPSSAFSLQETDTRVDTYRVEHALPELGGHRLFAGVEREQQTVSNRSVFFGFPSQNLLGDRTRGTSLFVQDIWEPAAAWRITAGIRHDDFDSFGSETSPRLSARWAFAGERGALRASWGRAFRAPSVGEMFFPFSGNPDLDSERSESAEIGAVGRLADGRLRLEATVFQNDLEDLISFDTTTFTNRNIGRARTRGIEAAAAARLAETLELGLEITWLDAEDRDAPAGERALLRRPDGQARFWAWWTPARAIALHLSALWLDDRPDLDPATFERATAPSYTLVDLSAVWRINAHLELRVRAANLLDEEYQEALGFPGLGRALRLGVATRF